jgi:hypothetical protein
VASAFDIEGDVGLGVWVYFHSIEAGREVEDVKVSVS